MTLHGIRFIPANAHCTPIPPYPFPFVSGTSELLRNERQTSYILQNAIVPVLPLIEAKELRATGY